QARVRPPTETTRRLLLLSPSFSGQRLQAAEFVPAMDGSPRRGRHGRVAPGAAIQTDRAARHPRDPPGTMPRADALHEPGLANGSRRHRLTPRIEPGRSGAL